jgi:subtilisin family serine protease
LKNRAAISTGVFSRTLTATSMAILAAACSTDPVSPSPAAAPALSQAPAQEGPEYVPGEVIVKFRAGATPEGRANALRAANGQAAERILTASMRGRGDNEGLTVVRTAGNVPAAIQALRGSADVEYAEPNWVYRHTATANDTYFTNGSLWGMYGDGTSPANVYGSQAGEAWAANHIGSKSVYVGIIDEGVQWSHPDLDANIWTNPYDVVDGVDNDRNGYIDDVRGYDFANGDNSIYDGGNRGSLDDHGTHVAGTIGAEGNNGTGVVGVNWHVTMISGKFLGRNGGTTTNAIKAVDYFTDLKTRHGLNIVATNNSWGGGGYSQALHEAIIRAAKADILFIAAAGNGGSDGVGDDNDAVASYPSNYNTTVGTSTTSGATYDAVIAVAAITNTGAKSGFSNFGATTVDIGAPGSGVYSTTAFNTYSSYGGTSMATPHVTGGAALYASTHAGASAATIKNAILSSAVPTASLSGKTVTGGRLNVSGF